MFLIHCDHDDHSVYPGRLGRFRTGGFPAMTERVAFLMKDLVLLAVSVYLLRQDVIRTSPFKTATSDASTTVRHGESSTGVVAGCC
jgi:hypothetical protein